MNTATVRCHPGAQLNNGINASGDANLCISATHGAACPAAKSCAQTWQSVWELAAPQPGLLFSIYLLVVLYIAYMQYDIHECFICVSGNRYVWALPVGLSRLLSSLCSLMCPVYVFVFVDVFCLCVCVLCFELCWACWYQWYMCDVHIAWRICVFWFKLFYWWLLFCISRNNFSGFGVCVASNCAYCLLNSYIFISCLYFALFSGGIHFPESVWHVCELQTNSLCVSTISFISLSPCLVFKFFVKHSVCSIHLSECGVCCVWGSDWWSRPRNAASHHRAVG